MSLNLQPTGIPSDWAATLVNTDAFRQEQRCLATAWTFLGLTIDVEKDGDWLRASIGGRSVFVQRFGADLRGFENRCAHRFFPLRTADRGHGPVVCGFHGWCYDRDGLAARVPQCSEVFGGTPQELGARLIQIDIALCGTLIFGRFPSSAGVEPLEEFLGEGFAVLDALSRMTRRPSRLVDAIRANWKLCMHISLDDYHLVAVHPTTFGKSGPLPLERVAYRQFGLHAAFFNTSERQPLERMAKEIRDGTFRPSGYVVFHLTPSTLLALFHAYGPYWYCSVVHYQAVEHDRSAMHAWIYPAPFADSPTDILASVIRWFRAVSETVRAPIVRRIAMRIMREDHRVCEALQTNAAAIDRAPLQSNLEVRIGWLEQSYRTLVARGATSRGDAQSSSS